MHRYWERDGQKVAVNNIHSCYYYTYVCYFENESNKKMNFGVYACIHIRESTSDLHKRKSDYESPEIIGF